MVIMAWSIAFAGTVRTSEPDRANLTPIGETSVDLTQGAVRISHALDFDQSPDTDVGGNPALDYNSGTVNVRPVIQIPLQTDPNTGNPGLSQVSIQLTFNGVQQSAQNYTISNYQAGAVYLLSAQVSSAISATGVYPWSATVILTKTDNSTVTLTPSGDTPVVVNDASPYGAGWGIDGIPQLFPITANGTVPAGVFWVNGNADARFFSGC